MPQAVVENSVPEDLHINLLQYVLKFLKAFHSYFFCPMEFSTGLFETVGICIRKKKQGKIVIRNLLLPKLTFFTGELFTYYSPHFQQVLNSFLATRRSILFILLHDCFLDSFHLILNTALYKLYHIYSKCEYINNCIYMPNMYSIICICHMYTYTLMVCTNFSYLRFNVCTICNTHSEFFICCQYFEHCEHLKGCIGQLKVRPSSSQAGLKGSHAALDLELALLPPFFLRECKANAPTLLNRSTPPSFSQKMDTILFTHIPRTHPL